MHFHCLKESWLLIFSAKLVNVESPWIKTIDTQNFPSVLSRLSLFVICFTHCVSTFGFLDMFKTICILQPIIHQSKTTRCEAEASCCSLLSYLGNRKIEQNRSDVTMLTIKMFISNLKFFVLLTNISTNTSKRKLCFRDISWNHTIRKSFRDSFIFRIDCAAWNELCFSQCCS